MWLDLREGAAEDCTLQPELNTLGTAGSSYGIEAVLAALNER